MTFCHSCSRCAHDLAAQCKFILYIVITHPFAFYTDDTKYDTAAEGTVRLVGGNSSLEGRVEIFLLGQWGTVCSSNWEFVDAKVVCLELGYLRAVGAPVSSTFGAGSGPSWYNYVGCTGSEMNLTECSKRFSLTGTACSNTQYAGAVCSGKHCNLFKLLFLSLLRYCMFVNPSKKQGYRISQVK